MRETEIGPTAAGGRRDFHALLLSEFLLSAFPAISNPETVVKKSQNQAQSCYFYESKPHPSQAAPARTGQFLPVVPHSGGRPGLPLVFLILLFPALFD